MYSDSHILIKLYPDCFINKEILKNGGKAYKVIPGPKGFVPKYITLETSAIVEILNKKIFGSDYNNFLTHIKENQQEACSKVFKEDVLEKIKFKGYVFDYQIKTDGYSVDFVLVKEEYKKTKENKPKSRKTKEAKQLQNYDSLNEIKYITEIPEEQRSIYKYVAADDPGKTTPMQITIQSIENLKNKERFKYTTRQKRHEIGLTKNQTNLEKEKKKTNDVSINDLENKVYSKCSELNTSYRTLDPEQFMALLKHEKENEDEINKISEFYQDPKFRKQRYLTYIKTKQFESKVLNDLEATIIKVVNRDSQNKCDKLYEQFKICKTDSEKVKILEEISKNIVKSKLTNEEKQEILKTVLMSVGNYSLNTTNIKGCPPSKNKGLLKLLQKKFKEVYLFDEYNTSQVYNKDFKVKLAKIKRTATNYKVNPKFIKNGRVEIYKVLTPKEETLKGVCVGRDINASENGCSISIQFLKDGTRPQAFCRPKDIIL